MFRTILGMVAVYELKIFNHIFCLSFLTKTFQPIHELLLSKFNDKIVVLKYMLKVSDIIFIIIIAIILNIIAI